MHLHRDCPFPNHGGFVLFNSVKFFYWLQRSAQQKERSLGLLAPGGCISFTQGLTKSRKPEPLAGDLPQQDDDSIETTADGLWEGIPMARGCVKVLSGQVHGVGLAPEVCSGGKGHKPTGKCVSFHTF